jgi:hypothetical protein
MYGQFQNSAASAAKWFVVAFFGVIVMAILLGANLKDAKWINPNIAEAEVQRIQIEAAHQQATYGLQERLAAAQTEAEIRQIQREQEMLDAQYAHDIQVLNQDLENRQAAFNTLMKVANIFGAAVSAGVVICAVILTIPRAVTIIRTMPSNPKVQAATNQNLQEPPRDYYREYLDLKHENRDFKHKNEHLAKVNRSLANLCQALASEKEELEKENFDLEQFVKNMRRYRDPAKTMKGGYENNPLAGD